MEPLEKLELIIKYQIRRKNAEREKSKYHSNLYIMELDHEINTLSWILTEIDGIKRHVPSMSDEMVMKMYQLDQSI